mmetsp:Transcript_26935/g.86584  ORF Transcript_26935/g.86584 Transcript_26935/m.86584 type:complete len:100 (+) Transcript_26935:453-752(+)
MVAVSCPFQSAILGVRPLCSFTYPPACALLLLTLYISVRLCLRFALIELPSLLCQHLSGFGVLNDQRVALVVMSETRNIQLEPPAFQLRHIKALEVFSI